MKLYSFSESLNKYLADYKSTIYAPKLGYAVLDAMIPGLLPGSLTVLAGVTSMGKTTFACNVSYSMVAKQGKQVLFFSLESGHSVSGVISKFQEGLLGNMDGLHIVRPEAGDRMDFKEVESVIKNNLHHCDCAIIDHIHYLVDVKGNSTMQANVGDLVRKFQTLAQEVETPIILISHVRKLSDEHAIPGLNDLKDSSALAQEPSTIIFVHRFTRKAIDVSVGNESVVQNHGLLLVSKNRDFGKTGTQRLTFDPDTMRFEVGGEWLRETY